MSRVTINMPKDYPFYVDLPARIQHINRGNHVGNDQMISFMNEARVQFLPEVISDPNLDGFAMINADLAVEYKSEVHHGETIRVHVCAEDFHKYGFDLFFLLTEPNQDRVIAHAKMGMLLFDFNAKKLQVMTDDAKQ